MKKIAPQIALYRPEIAGNVGTIIRSCVCFDAKLHIIEPCGFPFDMARIKKSALDYIEHAKITRHASFEEFLQSEIVDGGRKLVLATTKASQDYREFVFSEKDIVLFGQESAGVPDFVAKEADVRIKIPISQNARSLNIAISVGIILAKMVYDF